MLLQASGRANENTQKQNCTKKRNRKKYHKSFNPTGAGGPRTFALRSTSQIVSVMVGISRIRRTCDASQENSRQKRDRRKQQQTVNDPFRSEIAPDQARHTGWTCWSAQLMALYATERTRWRSARGSCSWSKSFFLNHHHTVMMHRCTCTWYKSCLHVDHYDDDDDVRIWKGCILS